MKGQDLKQDNNDVVLIVHNQDKEDQRCMVEKFKETHKKMMFNKEHHKTNYTYVGGGEINLDLNKDLIQGDSCKHLGVTVEEQSRQNVVDIKQRISHSQKAIKTNIK